MQQRVFRIRRVSTQSQSHLCFSNVLAGTRAFIFSCPPWRGRPNSRRATSPRASHRPSALGHAGPTLRTPGQGNDGFPSPATGGPGGRRQSAIPRSPHLSSLPPTRDARVDRLGQSLARIIAAGGMYGLARCGPRLFRCMGNPVQRDEVATDHQWLRDWEWAWSETGQLPV